MNLALWCVLIAACLPYLATGLAKAGGRMPVADNARPRVWLESLDGWPQRAHWAQLNGFESFPPFAAAVIICQLQHAPPAMVDRLALAHVACRLAYLASYIANLPPLRTALWFGGTVCTAWLFLLNA